MAVALWHSPAVAQVPAQALVANVWSLEDCIRMALAHNKTIQAAYLDRVVQKFDLRVAEDKFTPKMLLSPSVSRVQSGSTSNGLTTSSRVTAAGVAATVNQAVATGAQITLGGAQNTLRQVGVDSTQAYGWSIAVVQPLLKGGGFDVARSSVLAAQLVERNNILALKSTLTDTLIAVTTAYRNYYKSLKSLEISRQSVERARELLGINRVLIATGRMAEVDIVQSEADVASQEFNLLAAENTTDGARLELVRLLDLDINTRITPQLTFAVEPIAYELESAKDLAYANRPDYQSLLLGIEVAKIRLMLAKNNQLPDLSASLGYGRDTVSSATPATAGMSGGWSMGLKLTIPLGDMTIKQGLVAASIDMEKNELNLIKQRDSIAIEVQNALRNVEMSFRQVTLAQRARTLSEKKVSIETEKLKAGRSTNFQIVSYQNDLVNAQNNELTTTIAYLDTMTALDRTLGIALEKWGVSLQAKP